MKRLFILFALLLAACSSSQFTLYKPTENDPGWRVAVSKKPITNNFVCTINDSIVVEESFGLFSNNFEKDGQYHGKKIKMSGYRTAYTKTGYDGKPAIDYTYQVRIFIDEKEITKFDY
ncbi:MAG: hypothetical protein ABSA44_13125 [Bacteroidota bacterium]|jgi:hypothetical protein